MGKPSEATTKRLHALSGNICAFPGCKVLLVEQAANSVGEMCHIRAQSRGGPRFDPDYPAEALHSFENLLILCPTHHSIVDKQPKKYPVELLERMKVDHEAKCGRPERPDDIFAAKILLAIYERVTVTGNSGNVVIGSPGAVVSQTINIKASRRKISIPLPAGSIGTDGSASRYVRYLISRYNEFAKQYWDRSKPFHPGIISKNIEKDFRSPWQYLPLADFEDLVAFLQGRIGNTIVGKRNAAEGYPLFLTFEEHSNSRRRGA